MNVVWTLSQNCDSVSSTLYTPEKQMLKLNYNLHSIHAIRFYYLRTSCQLNVGQKKVNRIGKWPNIEDEWRLTKQERQQEKQWRRTKRREMNWEEESKKKKKYRKCIAQISIGARVRASHFVHSIPIDRHFGVAQSSKNCSPVNRFTIFSWSQQQQIDSSVSE